jgi:hypothetical protein
VCVIGANVFRYPNFPPSLRDSCEDATPRLVTLLVIGGLYEGTPEDGEHPGRLRPNAGVNDDRLSSLVVMLGDGFDSFGVGDLGGVGGS